MKNRKGAPPWKLGARKMEVLKSVEEEGAAGALHADLISWSLHPCHSYL